MEDNQLNNSQDRLFVAFMERVMERISALEDNQNKLLQLVEQSNSNIDYILAKNTSCFFSVSLCLKYTPQPIARSLFTPLPQQPAFGTPTNPAFGFGALSSQQVDSTDCNKFDTIKTIIKQAFPQCKLYIDNVPTSSQKGTLYLELENGVLLDTVMNTLDMQLLQYAQYDKWHKLTNDGMKNVMRSKHLHRL